MKNQYSIGIFDSGVGGLTVMKQIVQKLPRESIVYFGDTARVPYGGKSPETIIRYSIENAIFLLDKNIQLLVVACNTASSYALKKLQGIFNIPVIGTIEPAAEKAVEVTRSKRIGVLGTKGTIYSQAYQLEIARLLPGAEIFPVACPLFVPLVEESFADHFVAREIVKEYLAPLKRLDIDTLLLGCTHYPILQNLIQDEMGGGVKIVDSATTCAERVAVITKEKRVDWSRGEPEHEFFVSDDPEKFKESAERLFGYPVEQVSLAKN